MTLQRRHLAPAPWQAAPKGPPRMNQLIQPARKSLSAPRSRMKTPTVTDVAHSDIKKRAEDLSKRLSNVAQKLRQPAYHIPLTPHYGSSARDRTSATNC
jgi:hypothetical protein